MAPQERALSFQDIDESQASGMLSDVVKESKVFLGGSSIGKGLKKAVTYYMENNLMKMEPDAYFNLPGWSRRPRRGRRKNSFGKILLCGGYWNRCFPVLPMAQTLSSRGTFHGRQVQPRSRHHQDPGRLGMQL